MNILIPKEKTKNPIKELNTILKIFDQPSRKQERINRGMKRDEQKTNSKDVDLNPTLSIIKNKQTKPTVKRQRFFHWIQKQGIAICCL